jgi:uncharacterized coiled-coil protein SlyX
LQERLDIFDTFVGIIFHLLNYTLMEKSIMTDKERITELELQLREKDGIIKALQDAFDKQLDVIKMLRDRIDEMTPDDIA